METLDLRLSNEHTVTVIGVQIISPEEGTEYPLDVSPKQITFTAITQPSGYEGQISWTCADGNQTGTGSSFMPQFTEEGEKIIEATVDMNVSGPSAASVSSLSKDDQDKLITSSARGSSAGRTQTAGARRKIKLRVPKKAELISSSWGMISSATSDEQGNPGYYVPNIQYKIWDTENKPINLFIVYEYVTIDPITVSLVRNGVRVPYTCLLSTADYISHNLPPNENSVITDFFAGYVPVSLAINQFYQAGGGGYGPAQPGDNFIFVYHQTQLLWVFAKGTITTIASVDRSIIGSFNSSGTLNVPGTYNIDVTY